MRASFKNNYPFQILVSNLSKGVQFHDKENPQHVKHFYYENWKMLFLSS